MKIHSWLWAILLSSPVYAADYAGLGAESVSKATIEAFRPKPLELALSRRIQSMLDISSPSAGLLSPDGTRLYFNWRVTGVSQVWRLDGPQRFPVQMTGGEDATQIAGISPDGQTLVIQRDRKGEENPGLYLQPTAGGVLKEIQHIAGVQTRFAFVSDDNQYVYYSANDKQKDSYTIYRHHIASATKQVVFDQPGLWNIADQRHGRILLEKTITNLAAEYYELNNGELKPLFGQNEKEEYQATYGAGADELIVQTSKFGNFRRLYQWKAGQFKPISPEINWDVSSFQLDQSRRHISYSVNEAGYTRSFALDASNLQPIKLPAFKDADHVIISGHSPDGRFSLISAETAKSPRLSYRYEWATGKLVQWQQAMSPEVDTLRFAKATLETYPAKDGTPIPMFVRRPAQCATITCPVVVHFHGGPEAQTKAGFSPVAQLYVDAGFIFVEPNVRGSDGYGKAWLAMDDGPKRLQVVSDIEDASRYIRAKWGKGGQVPKVGIIGGSYGGYSTLAGMTMFAGSYDAGVSTVGISNFMSFLQNTAPYRRALRIAEYGDPVKDRDALIQLSPINHIDKLIAPLMLIQGVSDPRVPVGEAVQMYEAAKKRNVPAELMLFADEGHGAAKRENRVYSIGHTIRFLEAYLK
ncbi:MAG: prolyl oligopeptidase family serine peptidase [Proteobacteria bacterium]|nr:prolyl oligopeptidase family serine peptidase [Pseudomonadota bacterium]